MAGPTDDILNRVAETANRLRLVQVDLADESRGKRSRYLAEELERVLGTLAQGERAPFLSELASQFPTWGGGATAEESTDAAERSDPRPLLEQFRELAPHLSDEQKDEVMQQLIEAGFPALAPSSESIQQLRSFLGVDKLDMSRILALFGVMLRLIDRAGAQVTRTWQELAPKSDWAFPPHLRNALAKFVGGDDTVPESELSESLDDLSVLIVALSAAINPIVKRVGGILRDLTPDRIKDLASIERKSLFEKWEQKCWRKYCQLAGNRLSPKVVDEEARKAIRDFVEDVMAQR